MLGVVDAVEDHLEKGKEHFENALENEPSQRLLPSPVLNSVGSVGG
jgi:hypothetical protein